MQSKRKSPRIGDSKPRLPIFHLSRRTIVSSELTLLPALTMTLILCTAATSSAQPKQSDEARIVIEPDHLVAADSGRHPLVEPHLAVRPGSVNQFLAAAIVESANLE